MFSKVLIANRGEIAVRTIRTLQAMGVASVAVHSHEDRHSLHVTNADEAVALEGNGASETYLDKAQILAAAKQTGAEAIIPGYGFLSENADFAEACEADGIAFIGPTPTQMREFGLKHRARELAEAAGVPLAPGRGLLESLEEAVTVAEGDPLIIVEAMKMEFEVNASLGGEISAMHVEPGKSVTPGGAFVEYKKLSIKS